MANRNTRGRTAATRKAKQHFHGAACNTAFDNKSKDNKRKSAWRGVPTANRKD